MDSELSGGEPSQKTVSEERARLLDKAKPGCRGSSRLVLRASELATLVVTEKMPRDIAQAAFTAFTTACETGGPTYEAATQVQICGNPALA